MPGCTGNDGRTSVRREDAILALLGVTLMAAIAYAAVVKILDSYRYGTW